jgi:hypothetical protein
MTRVDVPERDAGHYGGLGRLQHIGSGAHSSLHYNLPTDRNIYREGSSMTSSR